MKVPKRRLFNFAKFLVNQKLPKLLDFLLFYCKYSEYQRMVMFSF